MIMSQRIVADRVFWWGLSYVTILDDYASDDDDYASDDDDYASDDDDDIACWIFTSLSIERLRRRD